MKKIFFLFLFLSTSIFSNELPELGSSFDNLINNADEKKIKFQIMQQVYSSNTVIQDPEINDYLNEIGHNLINSSSKDKSEIKVFLLENGLDDKSIKEILK